MLKFKIRKCSFEKKKVRNKNMAEQSIIEKHIKLESAAELLDVHVETLRRAVQSGRLKAARVGKDYRVTKNQLEAYLYGEKEEQATEAQQ
jgi:excisionase family DNA binding protein